MGHTEHVSPPLQFPILPRRLPVCSWRLPLRVRRLPLRSVRHDLRRDQEGARGREEEVRGLRRRPEEGRGGCNRQGEGTDREAGSLRIRPLRTWFPWCIRLWLPICLCRLWLPCSWFPRIPLLLSARQLVSMKTEQNHCGSPVRCRLPSALTDLAVPIHCIYTCKVPNRDSSEGKGGFLGARRVSVSRMSVSVGVSVYGMHGATES